MWNMHLNTKILVTFILMSIAIFLWYGVIVLYKGHLQYKHKMKVRIIEKQLSVIHEAITSFKKDTGVYPNSLSDLMTTDVKLLPVEISPPYVFRGPYIKEPDGIGGGAIPRNHYISYFDTEISHHWKYNNLNGEVASAVDIDKL